MTATSRWLSMMVPLSQDIITTPGLSSPNLLPPFSHLMDGKGLPRDVHVRCAISPSTVFRVAAVLVLIDGPEKSRYCKKYIWSCWGLEVACFQALSVTVGTNQKKAEHEIKRTAILAFWEKCLIKWKHALLNSLYLLRKILRVTAEHFSHSFYTTHLGRFI